jgi:hypothetical protein
MDVTSDKQLDPRQTVGENAIRLNRSPDSHRGYSGKSRVVFSVGWSLTIHGLPSVAFGKVARGFFVGWSLTIHGLPSVVWSLDIKDIRYLRNEPGFDRNFD